MFWLYGLLAILPSVSYGNTKINLVVPEKNKKAYYSLQENRKFDLNHLKTLKAKNYVGKITV